MIYIAALVLLEILLFFTNYRPGTFLIGWDNIMPEFNIWLNLQRSIFGVWQDYRGLGILDGMAQTANLFHTIYIFLLSLVLPQELLRYAFIMLSHLLGGVGFFFLVSYLFREEGARTNKKIFFLAGAMFYMFNLGVIQMFFAPLEVFVIHFAALPWLALFITKALKNPRPLNLLILFITSLLFSPQGFVPTIFVVFCILLGALSFVHMIKTKNFKTGIMVILTVLLANAFWLLPYSYSAIKNQTVIRNTRINEFSSEEIFYRNKAHGDLKSVATLKGFMLTSIEYDQAFKGDVLFMLKWYQHYNSLPYQILFGAVLLTAFAGLIRTVLKKQNSMYPYALSVLIAFIFLANNTIVLEQINNVIRAVVPILGEALRFPFTKFIILFTFCFSLFFVQGLLFFDKLVKTKIAGIFLAATAILVVSYLAFPAFKGQFTSPLLRLELPNYYKEAFSYFSSKNDNGRIAVFPMYTFWNWQYRDWGGRGSGFLWYGIPQPLTERAFDPWSNYNEQFYNEMSNAVNTQNNNLFTDAASKYNIKYILVDTTILNSLTRYAINYDSLVKFLEGNNSIISQKKTFGKLVVYELKGNTSPVFTIGKPMSISPAFSFEKEDIIYSNLGNYIVDDKSAGISYLMPSLFSGKLQNDREFETEEDKDTITFISKKKYPPLGKNAVLEVPSLYSAEFLIPIEIKASQGKVSISLLQPTVYINNKKIEIKDNPIEIVTGFTNLSHITFGDTSYAVPFKNGVVRSYIFSNNLNTIRIGDGKSGETFFIDTRNIANSPYLIPITEERIEKVKIVVSKVKGPFGFDNILSQNYDLKRNIGGFELYPGREAANPKREKNKATLEAQGNSSAELSFYRDNLFHQASYILLADSNYKSGLPVNFYMDNTFENRPEFETKLSKDKKTNSFVIPKTEDVFQGYGFHFVVKSVGTEKASSSIERISLYPFPEQTLRNIRILVNTDPQSLVKNAGQTPIEFTKIVPSLYVAKNFDTNSVLVLSQAYDSGWRAYQINGKPNFIKLALPFIFGKQIKNHVMVNNWENGWTLDKSSIINGQSSIVIVYLPQYLQYLGFILTLGTLGFVVFKTVRTNNTEKT
ncbi:MAG: hypothetical protein AAB521_02980 [Patescibacteria group bacterium]